MVRSLAILGCLLALCVALSACGGGGSKNRDQTIAPQPLTVPGNAQAPAITDGGATSTQPTTAPVSGGSGGSSGASSGSGGSAGSGGSSGGSQGSASPPQSSAPSGGAPAPSSRSKTPSNGGVAPSQYCKDHPGAC